MIDSFRNKGINIDTETYYASLKFQLGDGLYCDINNDNGTFMLVDKVQSYVVKSGHIDYNKKNDIANIILKSKADYLNEKKVKESTYITTIEQVKSCIDKIKGNWLNTPIRGSEPDAPYGWQVARDKDKYIVFLSKKKPWVIKYKNGTLSEGKVTFDDTPTTQYELEEWLREKAHEINYYCVH